MAARAVAEGAADVVGMTRAHLADPHLIRKSRAGRARESTRCVGANVCVGRALAGVEVACVLNPATGREALWGEGTLVPAAEPRAVVVVGAGPAGLRVAATAAARGHRVVVHERAGEPGGHLRGLAWLPTRGSWQRAVEDLVASLERGGGELRLANAAGPAEIAAAAAGRRRAGDRRRLGRGRLQRPPSGPGRDPRCRRRPRAPLDVALARARDDPRALGRARGDRRRRGHVRAARPRGGARRRRASRSSSRPPPARSARAPPPSSSFRTCCRACGASASG